MADKQLASSGYMRDISLIQMNLFNRLPAIAPPTRADTAGYSDIVE
jgi:hypothetical protein